MNEPTERKRTITCADVARLAGVHKASVSRVLNNKSFVSSKLRSRVLSAAKALNYRPVSAARMLACRRSETIGLLAEIESESVAYGGMLMTGISQALTEKKYRLAINTVHWGANLDDVRRLPLFNSISVDGMILDVHQLFGDIDTLIADMDIPCVFVNPPSSRQFNTVMPDDVLVAGEAVRYLIERGHRKIAYLPCSGESTHCSQINRMQGYMEAMSEASLAVLPFYQMPVTPKSEELSNFRTPHFRKDVQSLKAYLETHSCSAIVTYTSTTAAWLEAALFSIGMRVPEDVSIISCDFEHGLRILPVPITSLYLRRDKMGIMATDMLWRRMNNRNENVPSVFVKPELEPGRSVAVVGSGTK